MIKLIVGLGNPGAQYAKTRHNAGFWFLQGLAANFVVPWKHEARFQGVVATLQIQGEKVLLLQPETFMNRSGQSVIKVLHYFKIEPTEMLVVHDELDFSPGVIRLKQSGGHAGHNGLRDIISHTGTRDFYRLRVGIGRPTGQKKVADFVLSEPSNEDKNLILHGFESYYAELDRIVMGEIERLMGLLHSQS